MPKRFDQTTNATAVAATDNVPFITAAGVTSYVTGTELAASAPLTDAFWPNSTTALAGSGLADADRIPVLDGSTPKYIEAGEVAQASQFTSRYKPLASDVVGLSHGAMSAIVGSPSLGVVEAVGDTTLRQAAWLLDSGAFEGVSGELAIPPSWATVDVYGWFANAGAGSGDIVTSFRMKKLADGVTTVGADTGLASGLTLTVGAQSIAKRLSLLSGVSVTAGIYKVTMCRDGANGADTLGNDVGLLGVEIVRAS